MYPAGDLTELAERKAVLQARIAVRRWECAVAAVELARPVGYVDRGLAMWRRVSPLAKLLAVPAGMIFARVLRRRTGARAGRGKIGLLLTALPLIIRGVKFATGVHAAYVAKNRESAPAGRSRT